MKKILEKLKEVFSTKEVVTNVNVSKNCPTEEEAQKLLRAYEKKNKTILNAKQREQLFNYYLNSDKDFVALEDITFDENGNLCIFVSMAGGKGKGISHLLNPLSN